MLNQDREAEILTLVERWSNGDESVQGPLFEYLSPMMIRLARQQLNRHGAILSLESRDLANEASLRLMKLIKRPATEPHLMRLIGKMMRAACVDMARERQAQKRAGFRVSLSLVDRQDARSLDLLDLEEAMKSLAMRDAMAAQVTELRFFAGLSETETAAALEVSRATVTRKWKLARLLLSRSLATRGQ